jgi:hypothetical protein
MDAFGAALTVVMFVGAANSDATPEQRTQLKDAIAPLSDKSIPASDAYAQVIRRTADVMGPEWRPSGEWAEWITALLEESR